VLPSENTSQGPDDEKILKYAVELFRQLGITKPEPDTVVWGDDVSPDLSGQVWRGKAAPELERPVDS